MNSAGIPESRPEISVYRDHCIALLRRYFCMAVEVGRLPAILGREFFRTRSRDYHVHSFENLVIFVIDVERCLNRLHPFDKELVARIILQEHSEEEAARLLHCTDRTIRRRLPDALDFLAELFLANGMLNVTERVPHYASFHPLPCCRRMPQRSPNRSPDSAASPALPAASQSETPLVKPPVITVSLQAAADQANIFAQEVSGLPPQICYAGFVS